MTLAERARKTEAVIGRYRDKPFDWADAHCILLAHEQAVGMGHKVPAVPSFHSLKGAKLALKKRGVSTVAGLLDKYFKRLPAPAFMLVGDLCTLPGDPDDDGLECVCIADGQGNLFGWHASDPSKLSVIKFAMADVAAAWRL